MSLRPALRACLFVFGLAVAASSQATLPQFGSMVVFGDSLSDNGNLLAATQGMAPPVPPSASPHRTYDEGRFSNGPVAVERLWRSVSRSRQATIKPYLAPPVGLPARGAVSFAFGGAGTEFQNGIPASTATVPGVLGQVKMYTDALGQRRAPADALYVVWAGGNDYAFLGRQDPPGVVNNIAKAVQQLHAKGARHFLLPNLPDLGITPLAQRQGPVAAAGLTALAKAHNAVLAQTATSLAATLPGTTVVVVDVFKLGEVLLATGLASATQPALDLLAPGASMCLFTAPITCPDVDLDASLPPLLFWDALHPTTQAHQLIGAAMYTRLLLSRLGR